MSIYKGDYIEGYAMLGISRHEFDKDKLEYQLNKAQLSEIKKVKTRSNWAIIVSIVSVIVTLTQILIDQLQY